MPYIFDLDKLKQIPETKADEYRHAEPFPHIVIDNFLKPGLAASILDCFPNPESGIDWDRYGNPGFEMKIATSREHQFPEVVRNALHDLNSGPFINFLEELTGIDSLLPDPHLLGGGIHLCGPGGHLGIHADFNWHPKLQAHRRVNFLIYFNENWRSEYDGDLELWSTDASTCVKTIAPVMNRAVIFNAYSDSFHGHPRPLKLEPGQWRRSIAMYYYSTSRPENEIYAPHRTRYKGRDVP
jgi:hypothetical protein